MNLDEIRQLVREGKYEVSLHAQQERLEDDLDVAQIETAIMEGEIIEEYPDDPRGSSCLVAGHAAARPVHVVLAWARRKAPDERILRVVTVYIPRSPKWRDYRTRGEKR